MRKSLLVVLMLAAVSLPAVAQSDAASPAAGAVVAAKGVMLLASDGARLGPVYRVTADGSAQLIFDGRMVTIPSSTLSMANGKLTTSLSRQAVVALR